MGNMFRRKPKKAKWKLENETRELQLELARIREENKLLARRLEELEDDEEIALKGNDGTTIAVIEAKIDRVQRKIGDNVERYKRINSYLESHSKIRNNKNANRNNTAGTIAKWVTGLGGLAIGAIGLAAAYESDMEGSLVNRKTFEWMGKLPLLRRLGGGDK